MHYWIYLASKDGFSEAFEDSLLPSLIPDQTLQLCRAEVAQKLGLCDICEMDYKCHVMIEDVPGSNCWSQYCPILFHDVFQPPWELADVV